MRSSFVDEGSNEEARAVSRILPGVLRFCY